MKVFFTLAFLAITTIASAQPGHHKHDRGRGKGHAKHYKNKKYNRHDHHHRKERRYVRDYHYEVEREMSRYDFLRLSRHQRSRLNVTLNFLVSNGYGPREYERRLRSDLYDILSRSQYSMWEDRAYARNNVFVFNFGK